VCAQSTARERGLSAHGDSIDKGVPGRGGSRGEETAAGEGRALFAFDPGGGRGGRYNHLVLARSKIQEVFPLAACPWLAENSRLGFRLVGSTLHQGPQPFKYLNGVGDTTSVVWNAWPESLKAQQQSGAGTVPVVVGQRPIQNKWAQFFSELFTFHKAYHSYYRLAGDDGATHQFEVLGDPGGSHNQQVRDTYGTARQSVGKEHTVYATEAQASALINRSEYFENHPCPVCTGGQEGYNLVFHNSNSYVYNMLSGAPGGGIPVPAAPSITPGYARRPDDWY